MPGGAIVHNLTKCRILYANKARTNHITESASKMAVSLLFDWSVPTNIDVKVLKILIPARPRHQPYAAARLRTPGKRFRRCWPDSKRERYRIYDMK